MRQKETEDLVGIFFVVSFENRKTRRRSVRRGATVVCHGKKSLSLCFGGGNFLWGCSSISLIWTRVVVNNKNTTNV